MSEQVGSLQIEIDLKTKNLLVSQRHAENALDDIGNKIGGAERQAAKLNTQLTKHRALLAAICVPDSSRLDTRFRTSWCRSSQDKAH